MKRLIIGFVTTIVAFALATGGVIGAWAFGVKVPGMQGATYLKAVKVQARGVGGMRTDGPTLQALPLPYALPGEPADNLADRG